MMKSRSLSRVIICSLLLVPLFITSPLFELCAVGGEGDPYRNLYLPHVHIRVEGVVPLIMFLLYSR